MEARGQGFYRGRLVFLVLSRPRPQSPARTPPGFAPYAPFLGRSPGAGAFVPLGLPRSRVGSLVLCS